ncbi:MAG: hypothetical protein MJ252_20225 [archaeon]|nr:hypothetical protein [archaeon]
MKEKFEFYMDRAIQIYTAQGDSQKVEETRKKKIMELEQNSEMDIY